MNNALNCLIDLGVQQIYEPVAMALSYPCSLLPLLSPTPALSYPCSLLPLLSPTPALWYLVPTSVLFFKAFLEMMFSTDKLIILDFL
jgi:hypothetical protein